MKDDKKHVEKLKIKATFDKVVHKSLEAYIDVDIHNTTDELVPNLLLLEGATIQTFKGLFERMSPEERKTAVDNYMYNIRFILLSQVNDKILAEHYDPTVDLFAKTFTDDDYRIRLDPNDKQEFEKLLGGENSENK